MPPGRRPNYDARIQDLLKQLRAALVAREQARLEAAVAAQMAGLLRGFGKGVQVGRAAAASSGASAPAKRRGNRTPRSAAFKEAARKRMIAYWAARKGKGGGKKGKAAKAAPKKAKGGKPSAGRLRQIAAMKKYWASKRAAKAKSAG